LGLLVEDLACGEKIGTGDDFFGTEASAHASRVRPRLCEAEILGPE